MGKGAGRSESVCANQRLAYERRLIGPFSGAIPLGYHTPRPALAARWVGMPLRSFYFLFREAAYPGYFTFMHGVQVGQMGTSTAFDLMSGFSPFLGLDPLNGPYMDFFRSQPPIVAIPQRVRPEHLAMTHDWPKATLARLPAP